MAASADAAKPLRTLYPSIEAYKTGMLKVDDVHTLYYEESGNPNGKPVIVLHGGPGGGVDPWMRSFFNPERYRIIMFDQRGAGQSTPHACLENNTTWHLVEDIQKLRAELGITSKWVVFGGSWGSTLALAYAETFPEQVEALILRGIFLCRRKELLWFYQEGASYIFPEAFAQYVEVIPEAERNDLIAAYHKRLTGDDEETKWRCAKAWTLWEMTTSRLFVDPANVKRAVENDKFALAFARIENHYFQNRVFFKSDEYLLENAAKIADIPGVMVQGRYDVVCPAISAYDLSLKWPKGELVVIPDAGHSMKEAGILSSLIEACDRFSQ
jgi:proline iminopeptidase